MLLIYFEMKKKNFYKIIDEIEKCRSKNNVNWMNILRLTILKHHKKFKRFYSNL